MKRRLDLKYSHLVLAAVPAVAISLSLIVGDAVAQDQVQSETIGEVAENASTPTRRGWSPAPVSGELMAAIRRGNLFDPSDRRAVTEPEPERVVEEQPTSRTYEPVIEPDPDPNADLVLVGVSGHHDALMAFIEDTRGGRTLRAAAGDDVGTGRIESVTISSVQFEVDGESRTIRCGQSLTGHDVDVQALANAGGASGMHTSGPPPASDASSTPDSDSSTGPESSTASSEAPGSPPESTEPTANQSDPDARRAEILRRMQERRRRE